MGRTGLAKQGIALLWRVVFRRKRIVVGFRTLLGLTLAAVALQACDPAGAPGDRGVCWRSLSTASGRPAFSVLARNVGSLDDCAAQLEALRVQGASSADGAFQGYFIFVNDREVSSSGSRTGFHYPIFQPSQRQEIDADLRGLIADRNGKLPSTADIAVQRR